MKHFMKYVAIGISILGLPFLSYGQSQVQRAMVGSLDTMASILDQSYAPKHWKKEFANWDLYREVEKAKNQITPSTSVREYHVILRDFFYSMQDYHVGVSFLRSESASLPFTVRESQGRYFIVWINRENFSEAAFPFSVGDEIVTFNEKPIQEEIDFILSELGTNTVKTQTTLATIRLTSRRAYNAMTVPKGLVHLGIRKKGETRVHEYETAWDYVEDVVDVDAVVPHETPSRSILALELEKPTRKLLNSPMMLGAPYSASLKIKKEKNIVNPYSLGKRDSFLPKLGKLVWESEKENFFQAYIFRKDSHRIGYIRIPSYIADDGKYESSFLAFQKIIRQFEDDTDMLVIDQHHNPGGSVFYLYALASALSDRSLKTPLHHRSIDYNLVIEDQLLLKQLESVKNDEDAQRVLEAKTIQGYPINMNTVRMIRNSINFISEQWEAGKTLTDPYYIVGANQLPPHPDGHYTKPILVLVDELDFSGGDFFPAILQDNKRATIMGTRTAGAGGYVEQVIFPNILGIYSFSVTKSLAKRVNDNPLENLGVSPDIPYVMTPEDYQENYGPYKAAILETIENMLAKEEAL